MKALRYILGLAIVLGPFFIFSDEPKASAKTAVLWIREDIPFIGWNNCEKTKCFKGGEEQCSAQYCNAAHRKPETESVK